MMVADFVCPQTDETPQTLHHHPERAKQTASLGAKAKPALRHGDSKSPDCLSAESEDEEVGELLGVEVDGTAG